MTLAISSTTLQDRNITDLIVRNLPFSSKYSEVAIVCAVDICRAASRVRPHPDAEHEAPLVSTALDIAHELKVRFPEACGC